jgi:hypothetical protein
VSPAEAAASLEEPDWVAQWEILREADDGFEALLRQWRRWHWSPVETDDGVKMKAPAPALEGIIALAQLGIMPPRRLKDRPPGSFEEQIDDHMWIVSKNRAWRITDVEGPVMKLNSFGDIWEINLSRANWDAYVAGASAALEEQRK